MRVAIQPCGDSVAQAHYIDTIKHLVPSERVRPFLDAQQLAAFDRACGDATAVWGVTPGKTGQNKKKWSKLRVGDIALLYRNKKIFSQGRIVLCIHNEALAVDLWSRTADGVTWEYLYFMDDLQEIDVSVDQYNAALDYAANNIVQGFQVHEDVNRPGF